MQNVVSTGEGSPESIARRQGQVLNAIVVFVIESPAHMMKVPNVLYPTINLFQQTFQSQKISVSANGLVKTSFLYFLGCQRKTFFFV